MAIFAREITSSGITETTGDQYVQNVEKVGGSDPVSFLKFLKREYFEPTPPPDAKKTDRRYRYASQTVRGFKSACIHVAALDGNRWHADDSRQAECFLNGFEATILVPSVQVPFSCRVSA